MSDSELSDSVTLPGDDEIEQCLKRVTRRLNNAGDVTVNQVRKAVEQELGLDDGFFKANDWKTRSKDIISAVVNEDGEASSPDAKKKAPSRKPAAKAGTKRKSDEAPPPKRKPVKKAKKEVSESEASEPELDEADDDKDDYSEESDGPPPRKRAPAKRKAAKKSMSGSDEEHEQKLGLKSKKRAPVKKKPTKKPVDEIVDSEGSDVEPTQAKDKTNGAVGASPAESKDESELSEPPKSEAEDGKKAKTNGKQPVQEDDESEMSEVIDEPLPKKRRQSKATSDSKAKTQALNPKKAARELTPDEEEIKRLQGWLVKCGIRKLWGKELKPYDTLKARIKHLKGMLDHAGMTGRYSNEKAKQVKEERELKAELEAVQEYDGKWGQKKDGGSDDDGSKVSEEEVKPVVRRPKGLVDFGDSGDDSV